jgi:hypothetical protein
MGSAGRGDDFDRLIDRHRYAALMGCIHQRRFHLTLIRSIDGLELQAPVLPLHQPAFRVRCCSCGAPIPHLPLCTRCLTYF